MVGGAAIPGLRELLANEEADLTPRISAMQAPRPTRPPLFDLSPPDSPLASRSRPRPSAK